MTRYFAAIAVILLSSSAFAETVSPANLQCEWSPTRERPGESGQMVNISLPIKGVTHANVFAEIIPAHIVYYPREAALSVLNVGACVPRDLAEPAVPVAVYVVKFNDDERGSNGYFWVSNDRKEPFRVSASVKGQCYRGLFDHKKVTMSLVLVPDEAKKPATSAANPDAKKPDRRKKR